MVISPLHCPTCAKMSLSQAYQITYAIDRLDNMVGQTALSLVGGAALAPVAEAGYLRAMRNPISAYNYTTAAMDGGWSASAMGITTRAGRLGQITEWILKQWQ